MVLDFNTYIDQGLSVFAQRFCVEMHSPLVAMACRTVAEEAPTFDND